MREVRRPIALLVARRARVESRFLLGAMNVDLGGRKVWNPASVVEIEMGHDDVPDVAPREPEALDLPRGGVLLREAGPCPSNEACPETLRWGASVLQTEPGIDEDEPVAIGLDQKGVDHSCIDPLEDRSVSAEPEATAEGTERRELQVVDLHVDAGRAH